MESMFKTAKNVCIMMVVGLIIILVLVLYSHKTHMMEFEKAIECIEKHNYSFVVDGEKADYDTYDMKGFSENSYSVLEIDDKNEIVYFERNKN